MRPRCILHIDMDAFYASIEQRDNPDLAGRPLVVGGSENRGVVAAASYESRAFGIRSAMPMSEAMRRCPKLLRVPPRMQHYQSVSQQIFAIFREFTPVVEGLSLDEAFLDVSGNIRQFGEGIATARTIKTRIHDLTRLSASVGVAANKLVAKIASDLEKPDGLVVIAAADAEARLAGMPVGVIPGIGRKTRERLAAHGISTIEALRCAPQHELEAVFGRFAGRMRERASGIDRRPVVAEREEKSISAEETFSHDLQQPADMERALLQLTERTARRLKKSGLAAATIQVKIRRPDFSTFTRQKSLRPASNDTSQLYHAARELLAAWLGEYPGARVRLLGVGGSRLSPATQADLFDSRPSRVDDTVNSIRDRFGDSAVGRARAIRTPD